MLVLPFNPNILLWGLNTTGLVFNTFGKIKAKHKELRTIICPHNFNFVPMLVFNYKYESLNKVCDFRLGIVKDNPSKSTEIIKRSYEIFVTMYRLNRQRASYVKMNQLITLICFIYTKLKWNFPMLSIMKNIT